MRKTRSARVFSQGDLKVKILNKNRNQNSQNSFPKKIAILVVLVIVGFVVLNIPGFVSAFFTPYKKLPGEYANYNKLNLEFRTNILLGTGLQKTVSELSVASWDPVAGSLTLINIDPKIKVAAGYSFADYFASKEGQNSDLLEKSIVQNLGLNLDGYIFVEQKKGWLSKNQIEALNSDIFSPSFLFNFLRTKNYLNKSLKTNLTQNQINDITFKFKNTSIKDINFINLSHYSSNNIFDYSVFAGKVVGSLSDQRISKEGSIVEITNASSVDGVGSIFRELINNLGSNVLDVKKQTQQEETTITVKDKSSLVGKRLENIFRVKEKVDPKQNVDVKVVIGEKFAKLFDF